MHRMGGSTPYPDGTIFTDDVRDFSLADGSYSQGSRKAAIQKNLWSPTR